MRKTKHIAWLDLETTGSDDQRDVILEVGIVLTDWELNPVDECEVVIFHDDLPLRLATADRVVQEMHERNGLWLAAADARIRCDAADAGLADWLHVRTDSTQHVALAGSGVAHFDRRFIAKYLPLFNKRLTYWSLDVGVMRRFMALSGRDYLIPPAGDSSTKTHRALDDARQHLNEAHFYVDLLNTLAVAA